MTNTVEQYSIQWQGFHKNIVTSLETLKSVEEFVDVTLSCQGKTFKGHKVILSAGSCYFRKILNDNPCRHPVLIINDIQVDILEAIMTYIYHGRVSLPHHKLQEFLKSADAFKIKGIVDCFKAPVKTPPPAAGATTTETDTKRSEFPQADNDLKVEAGELGPAATGDLSLLAAAAATADISCGAASNVCGSQPPSGAQPLPTTSAAKRRKTVPRKLGSFMSSPARSAFSSGEEDYVGDTEKENSKHRDNEKQTKSFLHTLSQQKRTSLDLSTSQMFSEWAPQPMKLDTSLYHNNKTTTTLDGQLNNLPITMDVNNCVKTDTSSLGSRHTSGGAASSTSEDTAGDGMEVAINLTTTPPATGKSSVNKEDEDKTTSGLVSTSAKPNTPFQLLPTQLLNQAALKEQLLNQAALKDTDRRTADQMTSQLLNQAALKDIDKRTADQMTALLGADQMAALLGPLWKSRQPRMCQFCNRMFSNKFNLKQHILNMHTVGREMQCQICNKKVKNKWYLRRHHVTHHGAPLKK